MFFSSTLNKLHDKTKDQYSTQHYITLRYFTSTQTVLIELIYVGAAAAARLA